MRARLPRAGRPAARLRARVPHFCGRPARPRRIESLMGEKRVQESAKERGMSASDALLKLRAAGMDVITTASVLDEAEELRALGANGAATAAPPRPASDQRAATPAQRAAAPGQRAAQPGPRPAAAAAPAQRAAQSGARAAQPGAPAERPAGGVLDPAGPPLKITPRS